MRYYIPTWWFILCIVSSVLSIVISTYSISKQLLNYRKPQEQRLVIRIQIMVPLFSTTCLLACIFPRVSQIWVDPIREIYESFVIYTFFSLLTLILGGERKIITELSIGKPPMKHPIFLLGNILPRVDMSDPSDFLNIKRGILQYVWFKPVYCLAMSLSRSYGWDTRIWVYLYNVSATLSLYDLALFWKCLYSELQQYHPWSKFLCVKLIIFASYWQGMILRLLCKLGVIKASPDADYGYVYQNGIMCVEMIGFAIGHLIAFTWVAYSSRTVPEGARLRLKYAIRDCFGFGDLKWDFKTTFYGEDYNYRFFDSAEYLTAHRSSRTRMGRLQEGLRYADGGRERYWVNEGDASSNASYGSTAQEEPWNELLDGTSGYIPEDPNYPVVWDIGAYKYTKDMERLRQDMRRSYDA